MKNIKQIIGSLLLVLALLHVHTPAHATEYVLEKPHTQILFSVSHLGFSFSHGKFTDFDGRFTFNPDTPEDGHVDVTIKTESIEMNHKKWNAHMKNADFFNVTEYPEMRFVSTKIEKTGENTGKITGNLTLLDVTKPVTLDVTYNKSGIHPFTKSYISGFSARGSLKRSDFGMNYGIPNVGDKVNLIIEVEGIRQTTVNANE